MLIAKINMKKTLISTTPLAGLFLLFAGLSTSYGQFLNAPRVSQAASVTQHIGITEITVDYHRPLVNEREVWGKLVPYDGGSPFPWRAGANENTTITFADDVKVEGQDLKAGTYGLHMIPSEGEWIVMFSNNSTSWGSFTYKAEEDALRVNVTPVDTHMSAEALTYVFVDVKADSTVLALRWEKKKVPIKIEVPVHEIAAASFNNELRSVPGFLWRGWNQAAQYSLTNDYDLEQGLKWADQALTNPFAGDKNFTTLKTKADILEKMGKSDESAALMEEALPLGKVGEIHFYGRSFIASEDFDKALEIFKYNKEKHPNDKFTVYVGLARGYQAAGNKKMAIENWKIAIEGAVPAQKPFYEKILASLEEEE